MRSKGPAGLPPPRRRLGQNFLTDARVARRIVEALAPAPGDTVLEIGPGRGALTFHLLAATPRIAAIELDRDLAAHLRARYGKSLALFEDDILHFDLARVAPALGRPAGTRLVVAGNLPYYISKPLAMRLVRERERIDRAVLMFQREVAARIIAAPGGRDYGPLSVLVSLTWRVERLFDLGPGAFRPKPAVTSTVTRWTPGAAEGPSPGEEGTLRAVLAACFARRRRTLRNNLRSALPGGEAAALELLERAGLDPGSRAEAVSPEAFLRLARIWPQLP